MKAQGTCLRLLNGRITSNGGGTSNGRIFQVKDDLEKRIFLNHTGPFQEAQESQRPKTEISQHPDHELTGLVTAHHQRYPYVPIAETRHALKGKAAWNPKSCKRHNVISRSRFMTCVAG